MSKYRSIRTKVDGHTFHSKKEAARYQELKLLERAGRIKGLRLQPRFPLFVNDHLVCTYVADFSYHELKPGFDEWAKDEDAAYVVEDVKGYITQLYKFKKALLLACEGITIRET